MTTLNTLPVAPLLDRLFEDALTLNPATIPSLAEYWRSLSREEISRIMLSKSEYAEFYARMKDVPMPVSRETGRLLYMLARAANARSIVEFGTSFGLSTIHLAAALRDNGGGRLITSEFEPAKVNRARANLTASGLADLVEFRDGDAIHSLASGLPDVVDLVLLDGAKALYPDILALIEPRLRPGSVVVADNAAFYPPYIAKMREPGGVYASSPIGSDVELSIFTGSEFAAADRNLPIPKQKAA